MCFYLSPLTQTYFRLADSQIFPQRRTILKGLGLNQGPLAPQATALTIKPWLLWQGTSAIAERLTHHQTRVAQSYLKSSLKLMSDNNNTIR